MQLPPLYPFIYLSLHPYHLDDDVYSSDGVFIVELDENTNKIVFRLSNQIIVPTGWFIENGRMENATCYSIDDCTTGHSVDISPWSISFYGSTKMFNLSASVSRGAPTKYSAILQWGYQQKDWPDQTHRNEKIISLWASVLRRTQHGREMADKDAPSVVIQNCLKMCREVLAELTELIPSIGKVACEPPNFIDLVAVRELLNHELPPDFEEHLNHPEKYEKSAFREQLIVRCLLKGEDNLSVNLMVQTSEGPSQRPKQGFAFLNRLLGLVPSFARQNTGGKEVWNHIDLQKLPGGDQYNLNTSTKGVSSILLAYGESFDNIRAPLDQLIYEFEQTGWKEACVVLDK